MKFPKALFPSLVSAVSLNRNKAIAHAEALSNELRYQSEGNGNLSKRVRWDLYWAGAGRELKDAISAQYKSGMDDSHLDTALRMAMREIGLPQFA